MSHSGINGVKTLGSSLFGFLRQMGMETRVKEFEVLGKWPEIVGEKIAGVTTPQRVSEGILFVKVKSSSWRNELVYMKQGILSRIDKEVGRGVIKDIRFI
ncbi:MAG: DUF721 domain-containing protein [Calditrichaeota bacterium]|nr:DUF721 domain-containing protein [Calditrichota bacterium]